MYNIPIETYSKGKVMRQWILLPFSVLLLSGCISRPQPAYRPVVQKPKPEPAVQLPPPKKEHTLKEVQDNNFNPEYMYPQTHEQTPKKSLSTSVSAPAASAPMGKEECISMIGQEKYDKYTRMLGSEEAAVKRCIMLKSMQ